MGRKVRQHLIATEAELDAQREREAIMRRERLEEQKQLVVEARAEILAEMEANLSDRQVQIQGRVESERQRCMKLRGQQSRRTEELTRELAETRANIEQVRESYV